jgi:2-polyprenyl-3-methyl-5-hydroxy-6-metoxy-1,4-benzoquinol methylase
MQGALSMEFMYSFARLPKSYKVLSDINFAANRLYKKLKAIDVAQLNISDYSRKYLLNHLVNLNGTLRKYAYILSWSLTPSNIPLKKFKIMDYGGGTGILSLLAKEMKIGTVIYNDIDDVSCKDAKTLGQAIGNESDFYLQGDLGDTIRFLKQNDVHVNAIASYDVIEHIYDIEEFFRKLHLLSDQPLNVFLSSGANSLNFFKRKALMKKQFEVENENREEKYGHKKRDCLKAYLIVREEMIASYRKDLTKKEVKRLASVTRGMMRSDIYQCVDKYLKTKQFPLEPEHPTNTCDPYTGNWAEHLMDPYYLKELLFRAGFEAKVLGGYWSPPKNSMKYYFGKVLNILIYLFKKQGIRVAPFYSIYGTRIEIN